MQAVGVATIPRRHPLGLLQEEAAMGNEAFRDEEIKANAVEEPTSQTVHDPVCHMDIVATSAAGILSTKD